MTHLSRSVYRLIALVGLSAVAAAILFHAGSSSSNARAAATPVTPTPTFEGLSANAPADLPQPAREALNNAGAPDNAPTFVTDRGTMKVIVVRGEQTYLQIYNTTTQRSTVVATPPDVLRKDGGTWVATGGSADGAKLVLLLPDGVASAAVTGDSGSTSDVPVENNLLVVDGQDNPEVRYEFAGTPRAVRLRPPPPEPGQMP